MNTIETLTAAAEAADNYMGAIEAVSAAAQADIDAASALLDDYGYLTSEASAAAGTHSSAVARGITAALKAIAHQREQERVAAGGIPQHRAVDAVGPARINERIKFRGGKRGVVLHNRDEELIGYPVPLASGKYLVVASFGRHRYHEDASPMFLALGRQVGEKAARKALAEHQPTQRAARGAKIEAASTRIGDDGWGRPNDGEMGERIYADTNSSGYGTTYYAAGDHCIAVRTEYDWPESYARVSMSPADLAALFGV